MVHLLIFFFLLLGKNKFKTIWAYINDRSTKINIFIEIFMWWSNYVSTTKLEIHVSL